jgi:very-short-patch-repair endonuclease
MRVQVDTADAVVARIAAGQHGVVSVHQLYAAGLGREAIRRRVAAGRLHRVYRGVYAVGHPGLSSEGRWMAAVLACGDGAVLSHRSAAELWGMLEVAGGRVHITVPRRAGRRQRAGLRIHRCSSLTDAVTTRHNGIAVTTPARTIDDLRRTVSSKLLRRAIRQAEFNNLPIGDQTPHTQGTSSDVELRFLHLCRRHGIPDPEVNVPIGRFKVDFLWREERLVVETDSYRTHGGYQSFVDDRERDNELARRGLEVMRITDVRIDNEPVEVAALVRKRLRERRTSGY